MFLGYVFVVDTRFVKVDNVLGNGVDDDGMNFEIENGKIYHN